MNWTTGEIATVWLNDRTDEKSRREVSVEIEREKAEQRQRAAKAAVTAGKIVAQGKLAKHPYLAAKGFPDERVLVIDGADVRSLAGAYLIPNGGHRAIVMPARRGSQLTSVQFIWEDGTKKFLAGGAISGGSHRIATGNAVWLCEGYATGLSIRAALKGIGRVDTILCCFSAANVAAVAESITGKCFIAADHDKPLEQFQGIGAGEFFARKAAKPYVMPATVGNDFNDMHQAEGLFAVQRLLTAFIREAKM